LTPEQLQTFQSSVEKTQPLSEELRVKMEHETAALSALVQQQHIDEATLLAQMDKVLDLERELKHLHAGLLVAIKNLLTPEQQTKLRDIEKAGPTTLAEDAKKRLTEKVERIKEGAQQWADSGRDPSPIFKTMEEKVKPLIDSGKALEAEAEIDRLLEQIKADAK
jgi:hypothetical protein